MTVVNDWKNLGEELAEIKHQAYHEGYEKAIEDFGSAREKLDRDRQNLNHQIQSWHSVLHKVREAWSKETGLPVSWSDPEKDKHSYQVMFGHELVNKEGMWINMPSDLNAFVGALEECMKMANDFSILLESFEKNPLVKAQWDRLLVAMRMTDE